MSRIVKAWLQIVLFLLLGILQGGNSYGQGSSQNKLTPILWNNGKVYFFQGSEYSRYDVANDKADEVDENGNPYPRAIAGSWPGLFFSENIDAAVFWPAPPPHSSTPKTVAYFFKGNQFMRYDVKADRADPDDGSGRPYP